MLVHKPGDLIKDPFIALSMLKEGNRRFVKGELTSKDSYKKDIEVLRDEQKPFAVIVGCSDSRVSPEVIFDEKLGDLFVVRIAGNVVDQFVLGSIEYAVEHLQTPLVVVLGHSKCGAVKAACSGGELPVNIKAITDQLQDAVLVCNRDIEAVADANIKRMVSVIQEDDILKHTKAVVLGAKYNVDTGIVEWF